MLSKDVGVRVLVVLCGLTLVLVSTYPQRLTAQAISTPGAFEKGSKVQLQGCVVKGERPDSYVFSGVTAWPVMASPDGEFGPRHFWLENLAPKLREHVGRTVQVTGTIFEITESEIERNPGHESKDGRRVAIEAPSGDIFTTPELAGVGVGERAGRVDMKITLIRVQIDSLLVVMPTCLAKHP